MRSIHFLIVLFFLLSCSIFSCISLNFLGSSKEKKAEAFKGAELFDSTVRIGKVLVNGDTPVDKNNFIAENYIHILLHEKGILEKENSSYQLNINLIEHPIRSSLDGFNSLMGLLELEDSLNKRVILYSTVAFKSQESFDSTPMLYGLLDDLFKEMFHALEDIKKE